jgi:hypothetical protein
VLIGQSLGAVGRTEDTALTAFTGGCPGLRRILADAGITGLPILDWFHIGLQLQHLKQTARLGFDIADLYLQMPRAVLIKARANPAAPVAGSADGFPIDRNWGRLQAPR